MGEEYRGGKAMSGIRLNFIVEGQTEETFVKRQLASHLAGRWIWAFVRCVQTSRKQGTTYRGSLLNYKRARDDIIRWMKQESGHDVYFTTMFDLFRLPSNFPDYEGAMAMPDPRSRATTLQNAMLKDIGDNRLLPYIQVHEFEALVLADPQELAKEYPESRAGVNQLAGEIAAKFKDPELINGGRATAPSKRIEQKICNYRKPSSGPIITARIGLSKLRNKCPHFGAWLDKLESLGSSA